jgi:hypothetical protein
MFKDINYEIFNEENIEELIIDLGEMKEKFLATNLVYLSTKSHHNSSHANGLAYLELVERTLEYAKAKRDRFHEREMHKQGIW